MTNNLKEWSIFWWALVLVVWDGLVCVHNAYSVVDGGDEEHASDVNIYLTLFRSENYTSGRRVGNFDISHTAAVCLSTA